MPLQGTPSLNPKNQNPTLQADVLVDVKALPSVVKYLLCFEFPSYAYIPKEGKEGMTEPMTSASDMSEPNSTENV